MNKMQIIQNFGDQLIQQKKITRAIKYVLNVSFVILILGTISALPLRYFASMDYVLPIVIFLSSTILSFIYGFLGLIDYETVFRQMDTQLNLKERISAAWQFGNSRNPYSDFLIEDAVEIINSKEPQDIFPIKFSKKDPFIPLLLGLFLFLWLSNFSLLRVDEEQIAAGDYLIETAERIDAVNSDSGDKDLEEISEEYQKLGQKLQDKFMNDQSIENQVEELSQKLERKMDDLAREGVDKDSKILSEEDAESELYQLERKRQMNEELGDILDSLYKTFSMPEDMAMSSRERSMSESGDSMEGDGSGSGQGSGTFEETDEPITEDSETVTKEEAIPSEGDSQDFEETPDLAEKDQSEVEPSLPEEMAQSETPGSDAPPSQNEMKEEDMGSGNSAPGSEEAQDYTELNPFREEKQSGEFDDEENIRGDLQEGEQMKSFIRALPHLVDPTLEESNVLFYYRNQLETAVDKKVLPEGYDEVIRDYFLGIGVLNNE